MPELEGAFAPNREDVAAKVIDGELIVIRLSDGTYYSMDNVGTRVWELLEAGHDLRGVARTLASWYGTPLQKVESDVADLVRELVAEGLLVGAPSRAASAPDASPPAGGADAPGELRYETPRVQIYRDMGNLLALDPPTPGIDDVLVKGPKAG